MKSTHPITIGSWITLNNASISEIMADAGFDWLCIDMEHSVIDYSDAQKLITTIQSKNINAFVRVGENNPRIIKRILDAGADGIIIPMVNSEADALKAINAVNYPPKGIRGVGLARAQNYGFSFEDYKNNKANKIKLIVQIEHVDAIRNLDKILSLDGIDGSIIGPYDLSGSMGKPGKYNDPEVLNELNKFKTIASKYKKSIGYHVIEPDFNLVIDKIKEGFNFIAFSLDTIFLGSKCREEMSKIK